MDDAAEALLKQARDLLTQARQGDQDALGDLMAQYRTYLLAIAQAELAPRVQPKVAPSDVVQDTFLEGYRLFERFGGEEVEEFRAWLRTILLHKVADLHDRYLAAQKRTVDREVSLDASGATGPLRNVLPGEGATPSADAVAAEELGSLLGLLEQLPEAQRQVIIWRIWDGLPFAAIGERMGRNEAAARMFFVRALEKLQAEAERSHEGRPGERPP